MTPRRWVPAIVAIAAAVSGAAVVFGAPNEKLALVTVVADQAEPATALPPGDFTVTEEKDKVQVIEAVPAKDPLSIVLLVDTALPQDGSAATTPSCDGRSSRLSPRSRPVNLPQESRCTKCRMRPCQ